MKWFNVIISLLMLCTACAQNSNFQNSSASEFQNQISNDVFLIDVRTSNELKETGFIENAVNIDFHQGFWDRFEKHNIPKDKQIMVYCAAGGRSAKACSILTENGYT
ncbi:MAG: rhodanese-like domain-containing protein, partial [Flavobacteriales bacterium]|nr:rhodanese-like domain-containing protein [Flavobacteriales bacterium]